MTRGEYQLLVPVTVRWGDMDAFGHVNNAMYSRYFEMARIRFLDTLDVFKYKEGERHAPAIVSATINFRQQVYYPAELECGIHCVKVGKKSFTLEHHLFRTGTDQVVADGTTVMAWVDYALGRSVELPEALKDVLAGF